MHGVKILPFCRPIVVLMLILLPSIALGHPGHSAGSDSSSIMHYVTSPMHAIPVATGLLVAVVAIRLVLKSNSSRDES